MIELSSFLQICRFIGFMIKPNILILLFILMKSTAGRYLSEVLISLSHQQYLYIQRRLQILTHQRVSRFLHADLKFKRFLSWACTIYGMSILSAKELIAGISSFKPQIYFTAQNEIGEQQRLFRRSSEVEDGRWTPRFIKSWNTSLLWFRFSSTP